MPTYEFECANEHATERRFTFADVPKEIECPQPVRHYPLGPETEGELEDCGLPAKRQISAGAGFLINKVMSPPSQRLRFDPGH